MLAEHAFLERCEAPDMTAIDQDLIGFAGKRRFATILADPPWQFTNKTGKVAPEHKRLARYGTMTLDEIMALPVGDTRRADLRIFISGARTRCCPTASP